MRLEILQGTELALRTLRLLEQRDENARARELAPELHTTPQYLPQVLRPLVRAGWLDSAPGPTGGYRLVADLERHSLLELVELLEGPTDTGMCVLRGGPCDGDPRCSMHSAWLEVRAGLVERLAQIPISDGSKKGAPND